MAGGCGAGGESGGLDGPVVQAASTPRIAAAATSANGRRGRGGLKPNGIVIMGLLLLEALAALVVLVLIVWWTMFSGRKGGERCDEGGGGDGDRADRDES